MKWSFLFPHLIPNPTRSFDHNWDFPKAFWKESRRLLIAAVLSLTAGWSCQTICSISHGKQYKLIYGLPGWHNSPERLKAFLYLSTLWPSFWAAEAKDNCAHLSQSCWSERKESCRTHTFDTLCSPPISSILLYNLQLVHPRVYFTFLWQNISTGDVE